MRSCSRYQLKDKRILYHARGALWFGLFVACAVSAIALVVWRLVCARRAADGERLSLQQGKPSERGLNGAMVVADGDAA